jgi:hypothetical protein
MNKEQYIKLLEDEIEKCNKYLYEKYGEDTVKEFFARMDEEVGIAIEKQFDNFAEIKSI